MAEYRNGRSGGKLSSREWLVAPSVNARANNVGSKPSEDHASAKLNSEELARLYDLLDEYGCTLIEPTNRPLNVLIFEALHRWEVQEVVEEKAVCWPDGFNFVTSENRWLWQKTGLWVDLVDDDGKPCEEFCLVREYDGNGNFVALPELRPIPDYVQSLDAALEVKQTLSIRQLQMTELGGDSFTLWRAALLAEDSDVHESEAVTAPVAVLKAVLKEVLANPGQLEWPKFGPPFAAE